ncbi:hypothetical protein [Halostagnicola kamekurae]|uniref:Uncharacterized protein n=1 Tax=Halostagnicola kamekurae TaxID=619731 RepID=A0A1I6QWC6_9EURY|nr:hypothetical protein [Halostagnicola kamekurae]SFS56558.1 hypothetical protein SAMN04488556_1618 [Halostagnicola kamekurae]
MDRYLPIALEPLWHATFDTILTIAFGPPLTIAFDPSPTLVSS